MARSIASITFDSTEPEPLEEPTPGKNRIHLDVHTDGGLDAEAARWEEARATSAGT